MVYTMVIYVDGGCQGNGQAGSRGAAAAVFKRRDGGREVSTLLLPDYPRPTNQRAELTAIIMAQEQALEKLDRMHMSPYLNLRIYSDSQYAIRCLMEWLPIWCNNGWRNAEGRPVANRDLIQKASDLDDILNERGRVEYLWIPREENWEADEWCNRALDGELQD